MTGSLPASVTSAKGRQLCRHNVIIQRSITSVKHSQLGSCCEVLQGLAAAVAAAETSALHLSQLHTKQLYCSAVVSQLLDWPASLVRVSGCQKSCPSHSSHQSVRHVLPVHDFCLCSVLPRTALLLCSCYGCAV